MKFGNLVLTGLLVSSLLSACGKNVQYEEDTSAGGPRVPEVPDLEAKCGPDRVVRWNFVQPEPTQKRMVDLLFVVDTSKSLTKERAQIAATLPSFIDALPAGTDYRIGVMLAHGGASTHSGRLFSAAGQPKVLNSQTQTAAEIQQSLQATLSQPVADLDQANGEMMMYSLLRSLQSSRATEIKSQGFYREDAALSVVFISDENDVCYDPQAHGYRTFPDYVASYAGEEKTAFQRYCTNMAGIGAITPESTLAALRNFKSNQKLSLGAVIHKDPARIVKESEDAIGHGLLELTQLDLDGVAMDIEDSSYSSGLAKLGSVVSTQLTLQTIFPVPHEREIDASTVYATVDRGLVNSQYDPAKELVQIQAKDAGRSGSEVEIAACLKN